MVLSFTDYCKAKNLDTLLEHLFTTLVVDRPENSKEAMVATIKEFQQASRDALYELPPKASTENDATLYVQNQELMNLFERMLEKLTLEQPDDPIEWMIQHLQSE